MEEMGSTIELQTRDMISGEGYPTNARGMNGSALCHLVKTSFGAWSLCGYSSDLGKPVRDPGSSPWNNAITSHDSNIFTLPFKSHITSIMVLITTSQYQQITS